MQPSVVSCAFGAARLPVLVASSVATLKLSFIELFKALNARMIEQFILGRCAQSPVLRNWTDIYTLSGIRGLASQIYYRELILEEIRVQFSFVQ
jgi:hypothetical protein